ncbi:hypothetical protein J2S52_002334 [Streptomyces sp. DSM 41037]|nr:hypothetical protein [Streptomyces sp. DSM 41037]
MIWPWPTCGASTRARSPTDVRSAPEAPCRPCWSAGAPRRTPGAYCDAGC